MDFRSMRIKKIWLTIILICCGILCFAACKEERFAKSISLNGYSAQTPLELPMGNFKYNDYTVLITYEDGETETLALTEDMIPETDKLKFFYEGRNTITLTYKGAETSVEINVSRNKFSDNVRLNVPQESLIYNGKPFTVEVEGDIPGGTKILYPEGNTFENVGKYDMTAILQCDGYETKELSAQVEIQQALYNLENAQLYSETVVYDKDAHGLVVKGMPIKNEKGEEVYTPANLPKGVSVSYSITKIKDAKGVDIPEEKQQTKDGNKAIDAGTYRVRANFKGTDSNYKFLPDEDYSEAYLTIKPAVYDLSKIEFVDKKVTYTGEEHSLSIAGDSKLPSDVVVSYQIKQLQDGAEDYINGNKAKEAGVYSVKVSFSISGKNAENYTTIMKAGESEENAAETKELEAKLYIERAVYDISNVAFFDRTIVYTGVPYDYKKLKITSEIPQEINVSYTIKQIKDGVGQEVSGAEKEFTEENIPTEAGEYLITALFSISDENIAKNYTLTSAKKTVAFTILRAALDEEIKDAYLVAQLETVGENEYEIYFKGELPEGVTPVFTLLNNEGGVVASGQGEIVPTDDDEEEPTDKTVTYKYRFGVESAGTYTCVVTFKHNKSENNYEKIQLELEATYSIGDVANEG